MPKTRNTSRSDVGSSGPAAGPRTLVVGMTLACAAGGVACGEDERTRILPPVQVAMDRSVGPAYDDGELTIFEVKRGVQFPIIAPDRAEMADLQRSAVEPYGRQPWITLEDVRVQLSWTLTNLDNEPRVVELVVDPWNEFGRYWPGLTLVDAEEGEYRPNLSGIDTTFVLDAANRGAGSRRNGVYTYEDMDELARDFGTVMNLIARPPTSLLGAALEEGESALPTYVDHAFHFQNLSERDALVRAWIPAIVAGLTGIDVGLRTLEGVPDENGELRAPTIALEVVVEVTDMGSDKVRREGAPDPLFPPTTTIVTIGTQ